MGFLKNFIKNNYRDENATQANSSFDMLSEEQIETHLNIEKYGDFVLTNAIRPSYDLQVVPKTGYRHDFFIDDENGIKIPVLMASASREILLDLFFDLLDPLGQSVDVVLESSHDQSGNDHLDLYREQIDLPVLKSTLYDFEDILLEDGCMGIAVLNPRLPLEIQLDEHKLLVMYGDDLSGFEDVLADYSVKCDDQMKFITEAEHVHSSSEEYADQFEQLRLRLGIDD